jgi:hypothetical protein
MIFEKETMMKRLIYIMIVLIAFAACLGWSAVGNSTHSERSVGLIDNGSGKSVTCDTDLSDLVKMKDGPGDSLPRN